MHFNTLIQAATTALAAFTPLTLGSPIDPLETTNQARSGAAGECKYDGDLSLNYQLTVYSSQDGGLCGGFWDNLKGRADCAGKSKSSCKVDGDRKVIQFNVGAGCRPKEVLGVLWTATEPKVEGVECEEMGF
ncbi:hypothetical protein M426DRAFT_87020 [Hypoxylon sp. CI-4A]|nr:hypothetical protein M426DRAFT_87020 [Hypoxylon sp. CI-4A]